MKLLTEGQPPPQEYVRVNEMYANCRGCGGRAEKVWLPESRMVLRHADCPCGLTHIPHDIDGPMGKTELVVL